jgi:hypothetical protein
LMLVSRAALKTGPYLHNDQREKSHLRHFRPQIILAIVERIG